MGTDRNRPNRTGIDILRDLIAALDLAPADLFAADVNGQSVLSLRGEALTYLRRAGQSGQSVPSSPRPVELRSTVGI